MPGWTGYVAVADVDASVAQAVTLGGQVCMPPMDIPGVGGFAVVADPQGAVVALSSGVGSLVVWPGTVGAAGAAVSTLKFSGAESALTWPSVSVAWVVMLCAPSVSGVVGVKLQSPLASAVVVPISVPLS